MKKFLLVLLIIFGVLAVSLLSFFWYFSVELHRQTPTSAKWKQSYIQSFIKSCNKTATAEIHREDLANPSMIEDKCLCLSEKTWEYFIQHNESPIQFAKMIFHVASNVDAWMDEITPSCFP